jgi:3-hydroxybutyryl-CoA dehydrogenase
MRPEDIISGRLGGFQPPAHEEKDVIMRDSVMVIGSGLMGSGIAARSALASYKTILADSNIGLAEKGREKAFGCIAELLENGLVTQEEADNAKKLIEVSNDSVASGERAFMVIEAITEKLELKQKLFKEMDEALPADVPLLSNTSGLRITDIAKYTKHPERTLTTHFWFPAHLIPLVEVVVGDHSDYDLAVRIKEILTGWGKVPIIVKKDLPGQLANRILQAVIREAVNIVETGLADPEDVDTAIKMGMGIRFPVWGPLEHIEAVGLDLGLSVQQQVLPEISSSTTASKYLEDMVASGNLGYKTGKGFYDWSKKDMDALAKKRNDFIIEALKFHKKNP